MFGEYNDVFVKKIRDEFEIKSRIYNADVIGNNSHLLSSKSMLSKTKDYIELINKIYDKFPQDVVEKILGGEFSVSPYKDDNDKIPLFLQLDIALKNLEIMYNNVPNHERKEIIEVAEELKKLRKKILTLPVSKEFDSTKNTNENLIENIVESKANYEVKIIEIEGRKFVTIETTHVHNSARMRRDGEYTDFSSSKTQKNFLLYESEIEEYEFLKKQAKLRKIEEERIKKKQEVDSKLSRFCNMYFNDGQLPTIEKLEESLLSKDIGLDFKNAIIKMVDFYYTKNLEEYENIVKFDELLTRIDIYRQDYERSKRIEEIKRQEEKEALEQRKLMFLKRAKRYYNSKNFLWKFFNKKLNPERINVENLTKESLTQLEEEYKRKGL